MVHPDPVIALVDVKNERIEALSALVARREAHIAKLEEALRSIADEETEQTYESWEDAVWGMIRTAKEALEPLGVGAARPSSNGEPK